LGTPYTSDTHKFGTGFVSRHTENNLLDFEPVNERICKIWAKIKYYKLTLISTHTPAEQKDGVAKKLYSSLEKVCDTVLNYYTKTVLGDFNTEGGKESSYIWHVEGTTFKAKLAIMENKR
jgi:hypothetical protein